MNGSTCTHGNTLILGNSLGIMNPVTPHPPSIGPAPRILLTRMKYIGDVVLTTPVIRSVRERFPDAYIAYMGDKKAVSLLEHNPHVDEIIPFDFSRPTIFEQPRIAWLLLRRKFDVVVDLFSNPRSALLTYFSGAPIRIGKNVKGRGRFYTHRIDAGSTMESAIDFHYRYVRPLGVEAAHRKTEIFLTDDERREARIFLQWQGVEGGKPVIAVHPGATWPNKMWLKENFAGLINRTIGNLSAEVILSLGPEDEDLGSYFKRECPRARVFPVLPVRQLAAVLSHCSVFVSNDCGPMHIGVAVGAKTIGIFGPEPEQVWFPYDVDDGHLAMRKDIWCSPCRITKCFRQREEYLECMKLLGVEEVFQEVANRIHSRRA